VQASRGFESHPIRHFCTPVAATPTRPRGLRVQPTVTLFRAPYQIGGGLARVSDMKRFGNDLFQQVIKPFSR